MDESFRRLKDKSIVSIEANCSNFNSGISLIKLKLRMLLNVKLNCLHHMKKFPVFEKVHRHRHKMVIREIAIL